MSAVASVRTPGVLATAMPRRVAVSTSMLSKPTATLDTPRIRAAARSGASIVSLSCVRTTS